MTDSDSVMYVECGVGRYIPSKEKKHRLEVEKGVENIPEKSISNLFKFGRPVK